MYSLLPALGCAEAEEEEVPVPCSGRIMERRLPNYATNPSADADAQPPTASRDQKQRNGGAVGKTTSERQHDVMKHRPEDPAFRTPISYSMGAIPVEVGQSQKRTTGRTLSGQSRSYHDDGYGAPSEPLKRSYGPQSKSYGCTPKELVRTMGTTSLPREDPSICALGAMMAKGDAGGQVRQAHRAMTPVMRANGMSRSLPEQSFFPAGEAYYVDRKSRSAFCLQEGLQQRPDAYYSPQPGTRGDYNCKLSLSSTVKPKCADELISEQYTAEQLQWMPTQHQEDAEFRKKKWALGGGYPGDQHWIYDGRQQGQQHVVHVLQEYERSDSFREGGDTGIFKYSGDSSLKSIPVPADFSNMIVSVRDVMTGGDTPLSPSYTGVSTVESDAALNDGFEDEDKVSAPRPLCWQST